MAKKRKKLDVRDLGAVIAAEASLNKLDLKGEDHVTQYDAHLTHAKGQDCGICGGSGRVYCCQSFAYALSEAFDDHGNDLVKWDSMLPHFPGTNMQMNYCPFCSRQFDRLDRRAD